MEGIEVLHAEFSPAKKAGFCACLIAKFRLDLVAAKREIFVGLDEVFHQWSNDLFVRGIETVFIVSVRRDFEERIKAFPPSGLLPNVFGGECGEEDLMGVDGIHLFPDDPFDFPKDTQS